MEGNLSASQYSWGESQKRLLGEDENLDEDEPHAEMMSDGDDENDDGVDIDSPFHWIEELNNYSLADRIKLCRKYANFCSEMLRAQERYHKEK